MTSLNPLTHIREVPFRTLGRSSWVIVTGAGINRLGAFLQLFMVLYLTSRGMSPVTAGLVLTVYGVGAIAGVLAGGRLVELVGPRLTVVASMLSTAAAVAPLPYVGPTWLVFVLSAVAGASAQLFRPAAAVVLTSDGRAQDAVGVMGIYRLSINVASVIGPLLGGLAYQWSPSSVFVIDAATSLCFAAVAWVGLPRRRVERSADAATPEASGHGPSVLRDWRFCVVVAAQFVTSLVEVQYLVALPLQLAAQGWGPAVYTSVVALNGALIITCELVVIGLVRDVAIRTKVASGSALIGLGLALFGIPAGIAMIVIATATWTLGEMLSAPGISAYPALLVTPSLSGRYFGALTAGQTAGYAAGPALGAFTYQHFGSTVWLMCGIGGLVVWAGMRIGILPVESGSSGHGDDDAATRAVGRRAPLAASSTHGARR
jgi:MFS family permease